MAAPEWTEEAEWHQGEAAAAGPRGEESRQMTFYLRLSTVPQSAGGRAGGSSGVRVTAPWGYMPCPCHHYGGTE